MPLKEVKSIPWVKLCLVIIAECKYMQEREKHSRVKIYSYDKPAKIWLEIN